MRLLLVNENGILTVQLFYPVGGAVPTGIHVDVNPRPGQRTPARATAMLQLIAVALVIFALITVEPRR
jgi:hypothetical protein